jgi:drug/metabolite transporter (DMT)-like permease
MKSFFYTGFALIAFAFNSILCRLALGTQAIDAASFTVIRLFFGAVTLLIIFTIFGQKNAENKSEEKRGSSSSALFLFAYAICFSFAYTGLTTATGALILFGTVQATMISAALISGERPEILEWLGFVAAIFGLIYLVFPGLESPPLFQSVLMAIAGVSWAFYTLRGRTSANPLAETTENFVRTIPLVIIVSVPFILWMKLFWSGVLYAVLSGAIASGIGYSVWYAALKYHTATRAAILQLSVPVVAAIGGIILLSESVSIRLLLASCLILGGIATAIIGRKIKK